MANTAQITNVRNKVTTLIENYGKVVTLKSAGTITYDAWGEPSATGQTETSTVAVTDNNILARMALTSAGRLKEGESIVLLKGTETVDETYTIVIGSDEYNIMSIESLEAADIVVAYQVVIGSK